MAKIRLFLFYLLLAFLPTQLGRHFFFDFSFISGIRSDYLAPTIFLTDVIIFFLLVFSLFPCHSRESGNLFFQLKHKILRSSRRMTIVYCLLYLLFNSFVIASNQWIALYKSAKIIELILLGLIINKIKPDILTILKMLSVGVFYSSALALWQFILQRSIGGLFWFLGERTFYATTPGIALSSWFGKLFLRPYATFPHPNVLGGFLAICLPIFLYTSLNWKRKLSKLWLLWFKVIIFAGNLILFITFSRSAWVVCLLGYAFVLLSFARQIRFLKQEMDGARESYPPKLNAKADRLRRVIRGRIYKDNRNFLLMSIYSLIIISIILPLSVGRFSFGQNQSLSERTDLVKTALIMLAQKPIFGWGLNNFIVQAKNYSSGLSDLYIFQPVHNLYLLVATETGLTGLIFFTVFLTATFFKSLKKNFIVTVSLMAIIILGCFDHYFFTLQQAQLFLTVMISIAFLPQNT